MKMEKMAILLDFTWQIESKTSTLSDLVDLRDHIISGHEVFVFVILDLRKPLFLRAAYRAGWPSYLS